MNTNIDMVMEGDWYNPSTGHKFTVRSTYMDGDNFMVQTTDGQLLDYNMFKDYIQAPKDLDVSTLKPNLGNIGDVDPMIMSMIETPTIQTPPPTIESEDMRLIERVMKKVSKPKVKVVVDWKLPTKQLDTLIDILGVEMDDIITYLSKSLTMDDVRASYKEAILEMMKPKEKKK